MTDCSRRQALKTLGLGLGLVATGSLSRALEGGASVNAIPPVGKPEPAPQPFTLPPLAYPYEALEPFVDDRIMEIHFTKHHQAYIDNANRALAEYPELQKLKAEELLKNLSVAPEAVRATLRNQVGGHANHCLFWRGLSPRPQRQPGKALGAAIERTMGSLDAFKERLLDAGMKRFGSGWLWLSAKKDGSILIHTTAEEDSPLLFGLTPLVGIDVWEHAYYLQYEEKRLKYLQGILRVVDWAAADALYAPFAEKKA